MRTRGHPSGRPEQDTRVSLGVLETGQSGAQAPDISSAGLAPPPPPPPPLSLHLGWSLLLPVANMSFAETCPWIKAATTVSGAGQGGQPARPRAGCMGAEDEASPSLLNARSCLCGPSGARESFTISNQIRPCCTSLPSGQSWFPLHQQLSPNTQGGPSLESPDQAAQAAPLQGRGIPFW